MTGCCNGVWGVVQAPPHWTGRGWAVPVVTVGPLDRAVWPVEDLGE